jgi:hypothetical protein
MGRRTATKRLMNLEVPHYTSARARYLYSRFHTVYFTLPPGALVLDVGVDEGPSEFARASKPGEDLKHGVDEVVIFQCA